MATKKKASKEPIEKKLSLADIWDNTDSSEASNSLPTGEHEVRINSIELSSDPKKGDAAIIKYEAIEGDHEGKTLRQLYKLRDADGNKGPGTAYLMRDLELLGYKDIEGKKLPKVLKEISEEQPMVIINAKVNGPYTNAYLQGIPDDSAVGGKDEDEESEAEEIEVGDKVKGENDDGDDVEGEVIKINKKKNIATVKDEDDTEHTCELDGLTKVEEEEEEEEEAEELAVGDKVEGENDDGDDVTGTIKKIKKDIATVEDDEGDEHKCALSDLKKVEEEEEEIAVGSKVKWDDDDGDEVTGKVKKITGKKASVKQDDGELISVKLADLTLQ